MDNEKIQLARIEKKMDRILHLLESEGLSVSFNVDSENVQIHDSFHTGKGTFNKRVKNLSVGTVSSCSHFYDNARVCQKHTES